jgi:hypothetical protein
VSPGSRNGFFGRAGEGNTLVAIRVVDGKERAHAGGLEDGACRGLIGAGMAAGVMRACAPEVRDGQAGQRSALGSADAAVDSLYNSAEATRETSDGGASETVWATANERLTRDINAYRRQLETTDGERSELTKRLAAAEKRLASISDGGAAAPRSAFDMSKNDWADLAKRSALRMRLPCQRKTPWVPDAKTLQTLGLAPQDAATLRDAYQRSNERVWAATRPLCARVLGSEQLADRLGARACSRVIADASGDDEAAAKAALQRIGEVRAGQRPEPAGSDVPPNEALLLFETGENARFEADLARSFGPAEAHRLAFDDAMCAQESWIGGDPPSPK